MVKLLAPANMAVLDAIRTRRPESVGALAILTKRKQASLSRTLNGLAKVGIVMLRPGAQAKWVYITVVRQIDDCLTHAKEAFPDCESFSSPASPSNG